MAAYSLDTANTCAGGAGEVPYGEVDAYPGNTRFVSGNGWNPVAESGITAHDSGQIPLGGGDAGS